MQEPEAAEAAEAPDGTRGTWGAKSERRPATRRDAAVSFNEALTLLGTMTPLQRWVLAEQRAELSMPVAAWLRLLEPIGRYGKVAAPARRRSGCVLVAGLVLLGLALVSLHSSRLQALVLLAAGVVVAGGAALARGRLVGSRGQLLGRVDGFVVPLLRVLERDVEAREPVRLKIDLRLAHGEMAGAPRQLPKPFANPRLIKVEETDFRSEWLAGEARLADGGALSWQVTDLLRRRKIVKKGAAGKTKLQTKERLRRLLAARLTLKADAYELLPAAVRPTTAALPVVTAVAGERRLVLKGRKVVELDPHRPEVRLEPLLTTIGGLYARVRRQRPAAREAGA
jgi:hypothetical protein